VNSSQPVIWNSVARRNPRYLREVIAVVDYDVRWPESFREEHARLLAAINDLIIKLEHFGSTAVPGLAAKPIVDMLAGVQDVGCGVSAADRLAELDYIDYGIQVPGRRLFTKGGAANEATHHLHIVQYGTPAWCEPLRFRDRLRADPDLARAYARLKRDLAAVYGRDIRGYSAGKSAFVASVLDG